MEQLLIVEDDMDLNRGLCRALKTDTRHVSSCETLGQAREQLLCQVPDLVLLDLNLPDGNGLNLLQEIRGQHPRLPVILLTANDTDSDVVFGARCRRLHHKAFFSGRPSGPGEHAAAQNSACCDGDRTICL